jgi:sterol desaturase/sphingolipid hydroxylase (fatty acid hydroxylase superfamily)
MVQIGIFGRNPSQPGGESAAERRRAWRCFALVAASLPVAYGIHHLAATITIPSALLRVPAQKFLALLVLAVLFVPFERAFALRRQRVTRFAWRADILYFWFNSFFASAGTIVAIVLVGSWMHALVPRSMHHAITAQPAVLQFCEAFFLSEVAEYWAHRTMHTVPWLWRFHKVHHSVADMDWLASARLHPVDRAFTRSSAFLPLFILGFSHVTIGAFTLFAALQALAVHANVRFDFGPLRYILATPQFHHWHHAAEVVDKNFAAQLPVVDWMFGSLFVPAGQFPEGYGIEEPAPEAYLRQLAWPFQRAAVAEPSPYPLPSTASSKPGKRASRSLRRTV